MDSANAESAQANQEDSGLVKCIKNSSIAECNIVKHVLYGYDAAQMLDKNMSKRKTCEEINGNLYCLMMDYKATDMKCYKKLAIIVGALLYKESWNHPLFFAGIASRGYIRVIH